MNAKSLQAITLFLLLLLSVRAGAEEGTFLNVILSGSADAISTKDNRNYWHLLCEADFVDDSRSCRIGFNFESGKPGDFWTNVVRANNVYIQVVGGSAYPGSKMILRVDSNSAHQSKEDTPFVAGPELLSELRSGSILRTRWYDWPYNSEQDKEQPLKGYSEALDLATKVLGNKKFSLPPGSVEHFYFWEGVGLRYLHNDIQAALKYESFAKHCDFDFDPNQKVEEILASIPGLAGRALREGYDNAPPVRPFPQECAENGAKLARGVETIPNLIYAE